jgi:hypothetical protein
MSQLEARDRFRSVAKGKNSASASLTLDEAKIKFREAAATLDKKTGLDSLEHGPWGKGLAFFISFVSSIKAQTWMLPLLSGLLRVGGKTIDVILGFLAPKKKTARSERRRKT